MSTHLKIVKDLVEKILAEEIDQNKERARASLDIQLNCQKRFVNMEHPDFKMNKELKEEKNGIRFKNHVGVWFQEDILNDSNGNDGDDADENDDDDDSNDGILGRFGKFGKKANFNICTTNLTIKGVNHFSI